MVKKTREQIEEGNRRIEERNKAICVARENGATYREIGEHYGLCVSSVLRILREQEKKKESNQ
jgi:Mor family transcriptional regulator